MDTICFGKQAKRELLDQIKHFFQTERDEKISDFHAETVLNFMLAIIGPAVYNQAIEDAYVLMGKKLEELYSLEKKITNSHLV